MPDTVFTIIIVVYNGEKTIQRAIKSITDQTYLDYELLIVDGLSNDSTMSIVRMNAASNPRIRFISEKDAGIYDAMNKAIGLSKGKWLYFLGSDDWLYNDRVLEEVASIASTGQYNMIYGDVLLLPDKKKYGGNFSKKDLLLRNISHQAIFYESNIFKSIGTYNLAYKTHADWDYNIRCFQNENVTNKYINIQIAYFLKGGASSAYDIRFLKEILFPLFTNEINDNPGFVKSVIKYDAYWRLIRNAEIRNDKDPSSLLKNKKLPKITSRIIKLQKMIPQNMLKMGVFSKLFMTISYLQNRIKGFK